MYGIFFDCDALEKLHFLQKFKFFSKSTRPIFKKIDTNEKIDDLKDTEIKPMEKLIKMVALVCACIIRSFLFILPHVQRPSKVSVASFDLIVFNFFIFRKSKAQS